MATQLPSEAAVSVSTNLPGSLYSIALWAALAILAGRLFIHPRGLNTRLSVRFFVVLISVSVLRWPETAAIACVSALVESALWTRPRPAWMASVFHSCGGGAGDLRRLRHVSRSRGRFHAPLDGSGGDGLLYRQQHRCWRSSTRESGNNPSSGRFRITSPAGAPPVCSPSLTATMAGRSLCWWSRCCTGWFTPTSCIWIASNRNAAESKSSARSISAPSSRWPWPLRAAIRSAASISAVCGATRSRSAGS